MERYFKINDATPNGKILISMIHTMLDFDSSCATDISQSGAEADLIYPGRRLDDTELESLTLLMESDPEAPVEDAFKNIRETLHAKYNDHNPKKAS
ncbi:MAG: hypothetical protein JSS76_09255 [Bacteroidetes bacterium]|nr:hypothetical protein [Bacteroidota bacterium]